MPLTVGCCWSGGLFPGSSWNRKLRAWDKLRRGNFREQVWTQPVWYPVWVNVWMYVCVTVDKPPRTSFGHRSRCSRSRSWSGQCPWTCVENMSSACRWNAPPWLTRYQMRRSGWDYGRLVLFIYRHVLSWKINRPPFSFTPISKQGLSWKGESSRQKCGHR